MVLKYKQLEVGLSASEGKLLEAKSGHQRTSLLTVSAWELKDSLLESEAVVVTDKLVEIERGDAAG